MKIKKRKNILLWRAKSTCNNRSYHLSSRPLFWSSNHTSRNNSSIDFPWYRRHWCAYFSNDQRSTAFKQIVSQSVRLFKKEICKNSLPVHILDYTDFRTAILSWIQFKIHLECLYRRAVSYMVFLDINWNLSVHPSLKLIH